MQRLLVILTLSIALAGCSPRGFLSSIAPSPTPATIIEIVPTPTRTPPPAPSSEPEIISEQPSQPVAGTTTFPNTAGYSWQEFASGFAMPVDIQNPDDGSGWLFVVEREGRIRIIENGRLLTQPFLDISKQVLSDGSEQGLLGLAFHPRYKENGYFYVNYINKSGNTVISRFSVSSNPMLADPASEKKLLGVAQPFSNHNGGGLAFGPDGYLYIALGDGGSAGDPLGNAQALNSLLGKLLRIDVDNGEPYAIPADNPYTGSGEVYQEIWASGLRNPWRIAFDKPTGDLYIADVGQAAWEEINVVASGTPGGMNFGWKRLEGMHEYDGSIALPQNYLPPVAEYSHSEEYGGCSVTGGVVYRGEMNEWDGIYFYGDFCTGHIWGLLQENDTPTAPSWVATPLFTTPFGISTFGTDEAGEVYLADYRTGAIYKLVKK